MIPKSDIRAPNTTPLKKYEKPTFIKGPVLTSVTAFKTISGLNRELLD